PPLFFVMKYSAMNANSERTIAITICVVSSMPGRREVPKYVTPMPSIRAPMSNSTLVKAAIGKPLLRAWGRTFGHYYHILDRFHVLVEDALVAERFLGVFLAARNRFEQYP